MSKLIQNWANNWSTLNHDRAMTPEEVEAAARKVLLGLTLEQKVGQLHGTIKFLQIMAMGWNYGAVPYLMCDSPGTDVPSLYFTDGPRGTTQQGSTCFPVSMARGATFDPELEERVGDAIGVEARSHGSSYYAGVCINLLRHPGWGRAQETYSEDPHHMGEMGAALTRGVQRHLMACIKHYAGNSVDNSRFKVNVNMSERTLREVYLPHFKRCIVDEGAGSVMGAYNKLNGEQACHHSHLLRDILKEEWGFEGFVISDFVYGVKDTVAAIEGGLDVEMPNSKFYRKLPKLVRAGKVDEALIDDAVLRVLRTKMRFAYVGEPERYSSAAIGNAEHRALAREVAEKSIVLLENRDLEGGTLLPLNAKDPGKVAVIGRLAMAENLGDKGSSRVRPDSVVTPLQGIFDALPQGAVEYDDGKKIAKSVALAKNSDVAVLVVGYTDKEEGEYMIIKGGDRKSLQLPAHDESLIEAVAAVNANTVVVMIGGSAIVIESWRTKVAAVLMAWYPGMEGGRALADILLGVVNPSARMPCSVPVNEADLPPFDVGALDIDYGYFHGYRQLDKQQTPARYPFGYGLSYTQFGYDNLQVSKEPKDIIVTVDVSNCGDHAGEEVVQLYVGALDSGVERFVKELKAFQRTALETNSSATVSFRLPIQELAYYDEATASWLVEHSRYRVYVGRSAEDKSALVAEFEID